jgi:WD40 repeat protein
MVWDATTGKEIRRLQVKPNHLHSGSTVTFAPDGKHLVALSWNGEGYLFDLATGRPVRVSRTEGIRGVNVPRARFSPDGNTLAVPAIQRGQAGVLLLDPRTGKERLWWQNGGATAHGLAFSADGKILAVGSPPGLHLLDPATGRELRQIRAKGREPVRLVAFAPDGKTVAWAAQDGIVLSHVATGKEVGRLAFEGRLVPELAFTPDAKALVGCSQDGMVRLWDVAGRKLRKEWRAHAFHCRAVALSHDGKTVAVSTLGNAVRLWSLPDGTEISAGVDEHDTAIQAVAFSPDSKLLVSGGRDQQLHLWDAATWRSRKAIRTAAGALAISPDGKQFATAPGRDDQADGSVRVWDLAAGKERFRLPHPKARVLSCLSYSADGKWLAVAVVSAEQPVKPEPDGQHLHLWDAESGRPIRTIKVPFFPRNVAFAQGDRVIAVSGTCPAGSPVRLYDRERGSELVALVGLPRFGNMDATLAVSRDGRRLATGSWDGSVRVWEVLSAQVILQVQAHKNSLPVLAFSPDGRLLATAASEDVHGDIGDVHKIRLWDTATGKQVRQYDGHRANVASLAFSPDGTRLVSGLSNTTILVWDVPAAARAPARGDDLKAADGDTFWEDLGSGDAARARRAVAALSAAADVAMPRLEARLVPAVAPPAGKVTSLVRDLASDRFAVRERATRELELLADLAEPELARAAADAPLEVRRRIEQLRGKLRVPVASTVLLRDARAVEVLERIGSARAQRLLRRLAGGAPQARLAQEAQAALDRLGAQ